MLLEPTRQAKNVLREASGRRLPQEGVPDGPPKSTFFCADGYRPQLRAGAEPEEARGGSGPNVSVENKIPGRISHCALG